MAWKRLCDIPQSTAPSSGPLAEKAGPRAGRYQAQRVDKMSWSSRQNLGGDVVIELVQRESQGFEPSYEDVMLAFNAQGRAASADFTWYRRAVHHTKQPFDSVVILVHLAGDVGQIIGTDSVDVIYHTSVSGCHPYELGDYQLATYHKR